MQLSIECTEHIFSFLDVKSLLRCQRACKDWNLISNDHVAHRTRLTIWKPLPFRECDVVIKGVHSAAVYKGGHYRALASALSGFTRLQKLQTVQSRMKQAELFMYIDVLMRNRGTLIYLNVYHGILPSGRGLVFPRAATLVTQVVGPEQLANFPNLVSLAVMYQSSTGFLSHLPPSLLDLTVHFHLELFVLEDNHFLNRVCGLRYLQVVFSLSIGIDFDGLIETVVANTPVLSRLTIVERRNGTAATDRSLTAIARLRYLSHLCLHPYAPSFTTKAVDRLLLAMGSRNDLFFRITIPRCNSRTWNSLFNRVQVPRNNSVSLTVYLAASMNFVLWVQHSPAIDN